MAYIGNEPISAAFLVDTFSGNGSTVAFTMSVAPANTSSIIVAITGVVQDPSTYSVAGTTLTFSAAPPTGTSNISVRYLGIPASGVTTTAYRTVTDTTATAGQTTFTIPSYTVGYVDVYRNGVRLAAADYTATTGTTVVLASGATAGDTITTESFYVSSVLNAIPQYNGTSVNQTLTTPTANTLTSGSGSNLQLQTNGGTTALTLDTSGNAGLGVTPSTWSLGKALQVGTSSAIWGLTRSVSITSNSYYDSGDKYLTTGAAGQYLITSAGGHNWYTAPSGTAGNAISFTQAMTLDANGNLGLGTSSPFNYSGWATITVSDTTGGEIDFATSGTKVTEFYGSTSSTYLGTVGAYDLKFGTNSTERARIDSSGAFLIGKTTVDDTSQGFAYRTSGYISVVRSGGAPSYFNRLTSTGAVVEIAYNSSTVGTISTNGTTTSYNTSSDYRLKENIAPMTGALATVAQLKPCTYNWKSDGSDGQGFIAHELAEVVPDAVTGEKDAVDAEGNPVYQGIDTSFLVATLTAAIQELKAIVDAQAVEIAALKGQA